MLKKQPLVQSKPLKANSSLKQKTALKGSKTGLPKNSKTSVAKLKKKADQLHSLATRYRFADLVEGNQWWAKCLTCPNYKPIKQMQCGHFMSRSHNATRYDEENTGPQCYGCNVMHQGKQYQFGIEIDKMYGDGTAARLHKTAQESHPFSVEELQEIISDRTQEIKFYENNYG